MTHPFSDADVVDAAELPLNFHAQQLAYLRAVERHGTLSRAAEALHVSQPALSQSLTELERRLGVPLFERHGRRRVFTEAGVEVARFASEVLGRATELRAWIERRREGQAGVLTVGMIDAASLYALPETIRAFRESHPGVQLRLVVETSTALLERLRRFELDLAFVIGPAGTASDAGLPAGLEGWEVRHEPLYIYAPHVDTAGAGPGGSGDAARAEPRDASWALYPAGSQTRTLIDEGLVRAGIVPQVTLESGNPEILGQMVALGLGWSVLPAAVAEQATPPLTRFREEPVAERVLLAVRRRGAAPDARVDAFLRMARDGGAE